MATSSGGKTQTSHTKMLSVWSRQAEVRAESMSSCQVLSECLRFAWMSEATVLRQNAIDRAELALRSQAEF